MAKNFSDLPPEKRAELGRKGGIKSGEVKRANKERRRSLREAFEVVLQMPLKNGKAYDIDEIKNFAAIKGKNMSVQDAIVAKAVQDFLKTGNPKMFELIRDTIGEKPKDNANINMQLPVFYEGEGDLED